MDLTQRVSLMLSGALAVSSWTAAWTQNIGASGPASPPAQVPAPRREGPLPSWPEPPKAPAGAPNVVLILLDDAGFGASSCFGGPVSAPNLEALAKSGLGENGSQPNN